MPIKTFSKRIKAKAVDKVKSGMSVNQVAKIVKTTPASVRAWMLKADNGNHSEPSKPLTIRKVLNKELKRKGKEIVSSYLIVKENLELRQENSVLLKIIKRLL